MLRLIGPLGRRTATRASARRALSSSAAASASASADEPSRWPVRLAVAASSCVAALGVGIAAESAWDDRVEVREGDEEHEEATGERTRKMPRRALTKTLRSSTSASPPLGSVARCEGVVFDSPPVEAKFEERSYTGSQYSGGEDEEKAPFRTIPHGELMNDDVDGGSGSSGSDGQSSDNDDNLDASNIHKHDLGPLSSRAHAAAAASGLLDSYDDGVDDWDEGSRVAGEAEGDEEKAKPNNSAVVENFLSFSPPELSPPVAQPANVQPRTSVRHTARRVHMGDDEDDDDEEEGEDVVGESEAGRNSGGPLATSETADDSADEPVAADDDKESALRRINTVRRNGLGKDQVYTKNMYFYKSSSIKPSLRNRFRLFALPSSERLGRETAYLLGTDLSLVDVGSFADGETTVQVQDGVRGKEVFVVCSTASSTAMVELLLTISAMRRGSAKRICAVIPYYGYSRQDRRTWKNREPIAAADVARLLEEMGADSVICVDLHNPLLRGFFSPSTPVDHLAPGPVAAAYFYEGLFGEGEKGEDGEGEEKEKGEPPKITVVAAHENQVFRANGFRNALRKLSGSDDVRVALISHQKALNVHGKSTAATLVGDVEGRKCIIVDDIVNTGGTMRSAIEMVDKCGASEVYAWATHGVLHLPENDAPEKIQDMDCLKYLLISNSVAIDRDLPPKIRKLSIAPLLAESISRALSQGSIRSLLNVKTSAKSDK